jgi:hypothetical protein
MLERFYAGHDVFPAARPWFRAALCYAVDGSLGRWAREEDPNTLLGMAKAIGEAVRSAEAINPGLGDAPFVQMPEDVVLAIVPPTIFDLLELPNPPWGWGLVLNPHFWVDRGLPAIKAEVARRNRPIRASGPLGMLKQLDLQTVAGKHTVLASAGPNKLKGRCPLHDERTPSFYVFLDSNRWRCFGACATGGDVVNLLEQLARKEGVRV